MKGFFLLSFLCGCVFSQQLITLTLYNSTTCSVSTKNALGGPFIFRVPASGPSNCLVLCVDTVIPGCYGHTLSATSSATTFTLSVFASTACAGTSFPAQSPVLSPSSSPTQTCNIGVGPLIGYYLTAASSIISYSVLLACFLAMVLATL